ncbi:MAG: hypothetical protein WBD55_08555 [Dehalococcoidia bacterium]
MFLASFALHPFLHGEAVATGGAAFVTLAILALVVLVTAAVIENLQR